MTRRNLYQHLDKTEQLKRDFELITYGEFYLSNRQEQKRYKKECKLHFKQITFNNQ